jgi:hypothetical protein
MTFRDFDRADEVVHARTGRRRHAHGRAGEPLGRPRAGFTGARRASVVAAAPRGARAPRRRRRISG